VEQEGLGQGGLAGAVMGNEGDGSLLGDVFHEAPPIRRFPVYTMVQYGPNRLPLSRSYG